MSTTCETGVAVSQLRYPARELFRTLVSVTFQLETECGLVADSAWRQCVRVKEDVMPCLTVLAVDRPSKKREHEPPLLFCAISNVTYQVPSGHFPWSRSPECPPQQHTVLTHGMLLSTLTRATRFASISSSGTASPSAAVRIMHEASNLYLSYSVSDMLYARTMSHRMNISAKAVGCVF